MKPLLLLSRGGDDADLLYACRLSVERALYIRFADGDDLLAVHPLELERARVESTAATVLDAQEEGFDGGPDRLSAWCDLAARILARRGVTDVRVSPLLPAAAYEGLRAAGVRPEIDEDLFIAERRRKSREEADWIRAAQEAAEAACVEIVGRLAAAEAGGDGLLWLEGSPLTSERLMAAAQSALNEIGYGAAEMIIAGSPECALPHFRGAGPIRAGRPVIIDLFPRGFTSHRHGDLTRTVVAGGPPSDDIRRMHDVCVEALDGAIAAIRHGADARDVHRGVCRLLVERGYGTSTPGFEGAAGRPRMIHSTGHGVGLEVHEAPYLRDASGSLATGDVVTIEPGLYLNGLGGVRVEDTGIVTADGFRNFTTLPRSLDPADYL